MLTALLGRVPALEPARLADHAVVGLAGRSYPGLVRAGGREARGWVCGDLAPGEWDVLDRWEDACYELVTVAVRTDGGSVRTCGTYRLGGGVPGSGGWSAAAFAQRHLAGYAEATARWRASVGPC